ILGTAHGYFVLEESFAAYSRAIAGYQVSQSEIWDQLLDMSHRHARLLVIVATPFSIASIWFVRTLLLWFMGLVFDAPINLRRSAAMIGTSYLPFAGLSVIGIALLLALPIGADFALAERGTVETTFAASLADYFTRLQDSPALRLTAATRVSAELASAAIIIYRLESDRLIGWRKGLICVATIGFVVHFPELLSLIISPD